MANNYNRIAAYYDAIGRIVYGNAIVDAQKWLLQYIPAGSNILIIGGGTGWILEEIARLHKEGLSITYIDISSKMIALAQKRNYERNTVNFITGSIENYTGNELYHVIITAFLFDNFKKEKIDVVFPKLDNMLLPNCIWLYADFVNERSKNSWWQKLLLKTMYLFFRITTHIEADELIPMNPYFSEHYNIIAEERFYRQFIRSVVYQKTN